MSTIFDALYSVMVDLINVPNEILTEFNFFGLFDPLEFGSGWLLANELITKSEVNDYKQWSSKTSNYFHNEILHFEVLPDSFSIWVYNQFSFDLLKNITKRIINVVGNKFNSEFELSIKVHYDLKSISAINKLYNVLIPAVPFNTILEKPLIRGFFINDRKVQSKFILSRRISISDCTKDSRPNNIHLFIHNRVEIGKFYGGKNEKGKITTFKNLDNDLDSILNKSKEVLNYFTENYMSI